MNILIKTTLRNIAGKPFRSLLVIFSIFACSLTALFCFDLANANNTYFQAAFRTMAGKGDITMNGECIDLSMLPADFPEYDCVQYRTFNEYRYLDIEGEYYVVHADKLRITSVNVADAGAMGIIQTGLELGDGQIIITDSYGKKYDADIGDTVILHDMNGDPVELEVVNIIPTTVMNVMRRTGACIVNENTGDVLAAGRDSKPIYILNIHNDSLITQAEEMLRQTYPNAYVSRLTPNDSMLEGNEEIMGIMFMIFAIAFLLVIFITASLCERIVSERMSYIGTLRSLGLSARSTGYILLIENVFYALIGSIPSTILYACFREMIMNFFFDSGDDMGGNIIPALSPLLLIGVIAGAVVIECIIPLRAQFKALKVSIRDIIFDNRDTEYKLSRSGIVLGIILAVIGIIAFTLRNNIFAASVCLIATVMAVAFLYPLFLKLITNFIASRAHKADNERWALAAVETGSRKSAVGSGILSVSSSAMCIIIFAIALTMMGAMTTEEFDCDVIVDTNHESTYYAFADRMDGINETEFVYSDAETVRLNDREVFSEFYGMPDGGFNMFHQFEEVPVIADGTVAVENSWASKNGIHEGDVITITFNADSVFPIVREFTVAGTFKNLGMSHAETSMIFSITDFVDIYHDNPGYLLIRCDDPDQTAALIKRYAVGLYDDVQTQTELNEMSQKANKSSVLIFTVIIGVALGMTAIGMSSNQLIGFEGRKKECAVMLSTAMTKETLISILFRESLLSALISGTLGLLTGSLLVLVIKDALTSSEILYLKIVYSPLHTVLVWLGMIALFALTVLFPIRSLNKMKISEQIKCE